MFKNPCEKDKRVESVIIHKMKEVDRNTIFEIKNSVEKYKAWKGNIYIPSLDMTLECNIQNIHTKFGENNYAITFQDISSKLRTERYLIEYEKIKKHEEVKNEFFANISHELRTPINLISSTIQLIKLKLNKLSPEDSRNFDKYIKIMEINSFRLVRLINNLLDSTKIDAGFTSFTPVSADIINFVEGVCDSFTEYAKFNKVNLIFDTNEEEEVVLFDPDIIERILLNLLSNAVKFNKVGGNIYVNVDIKKEKIIISVEDEGMGIAEDKIDYIFKRFEQVQNNKKIERQGSGIGLYLVKSLIDLHGGTIEVKSKVDKGSKFTVSIPKKEAKDSEQTIIYDDNRYKRDKVEFSDI